jgi:DNA-binding NarL/FixJ family response regulator
VVLMDVRMPDLDGIGATCELTHAAPRARVLILTTFEQDDYIFGALARGHRTSCSNGRDPRS